MVGPLCEYGIKWADGDFAPSWVHDALPLVIVFKAPNGGKRPAVLREPVFDQRCRRMCEAYGCRLVGADAVDTKRLWIGATSTTWKSPSLGLPDFELVDVFRLVSALVLTSIQLVAALHEAYSSFTTSTPLALSSYSCLAASSGGSGVVPYSDGSGLTHTGVQPCEKNFQDLVGPGVSS